VSSLAIVNPESSEAWMIDATPDFPSQLNAITSIHGAELKGIFLTHAHIGHYTGLIHLGKEVMGSKMMPVYAMPRLKSFLENNGPWSQLVALNNIMISKLQDGEPVKLTDHISVTPFIVPHRDEFSETVGYRISGLDREIIYIPDIDKWTKWKRDIREIVKNTDVAILDGTFYENGELPNRDMNDIPHPFIEETMNLFNESSSDEKGKIHFIHFNHTNPAHDEKSRASESIQKQGFHIAREGEKFKL
jgi:pyrroloquinoline quinone biosynthesis protein B